ncbi:phage tail protein [Pseudomonas viridiflava]|uniref:phage tail protein n=1 Tax=Pseudomonas viridiflava TaxID=33069 RepID=UPI000F0325CD|nr:phage tail protein [Pseudomonas viridiflava]MEE3929633.1 phage tail protein [Pseudomonas viridiflava]MEE3980826.1 phage tail protein [Pseudomonas viridiflava]MEE3989560.1 phage tail protein [Pseudomonas viridiflava]MEE4028106.1 phage tail protein [Pseudomonas viridiflava]MEE4034270.1 phage tail protein [Pseudomonas viridiflava]
MARAAINILGATGVTFDFVTQGDTKVTSARPSKGIYTVSGTLGMVPYPPVDVGWGYTLNQIDSRADVEIEFENGLLTVTVTKDGQPYDLKHMITLHILVPDPAPIYMPEFPPAPAPSAAEEDVSMSVSALVKDADQAAAE